jgi:DNA-binding winged helix-turn-helix (wHTH) protein
VARPLFNTNPVRVSFDECDLDEVNAWLLYRGNAVAIAPTSFDLLCALARQPGTLQAKDAPLDAVWGHHFFNESVLKTAISDPRSALGDNPYEPRFIETVSRRGYRFIAATAITTSAPPYPPSRPTMDAPIGQPRSQSFIGHSDAVAQLRRAWDEARGE